MIMLQKQLVVAGIFLCACLVLITSEGERRAEVEQKEAVARDPQGRVVPFPRRMLTFGEAASRATRNLTPATSPFARNIVARAARPMTQRVQQLPVDVQTTIASYLEEDKYDLWKTLNIPADQLAFRDNGHLVSLNYSLINRQASPEVTVRNMTNGSLQRFKLLLPPTLVHDLLLSADGTTIAASNVSGTRVYVWNTSDSMLKKTIDISADEQIDQLKMISNNGNVLITGFYQPIRLLYLDSGRFTPLEIVNDNNPSILIYSLSPDSKTFLSVIGPRATTVGFWNVQDGSYQYGLGLEDQSLAITKVVSNNNSTIIAVITGNKISLFRNDVQADDLKKLSELTIPFSYGLIGMMVEMIFSHDSKTLAVFWNGFVLLWDVATGKLIQEMRIPTELYAHKTTFAFSPDDTLFAIALGNAIQLYKKSTAFSDALEKRKKIEELSLQKAAQQQALHRVRSPEEQGILFVDQPGAQPVAVTAPAVAIHTQPSAGKSDESLKMDEPD